MEFPRADNIISWVTKNVLNDFIPQEFMCVLLTSVDKMFANNF